VSDQQTSESGKTPAADSNESASDPISKSIDDASAKAHKAIGKAAEQTSATVESLTDQAKSAYRRASQTASGAAEVVEPFVQERPYAALGLAAAAGLVAGLLLAGRSPKTIYIRSPRA